MAAAGTTAEKETSHARSKRQQQLLAHAPIEATRATWTCCASSRCCDSLEAVYSEARQSLKQHSGSEAAKHEPRRRSTRTTRRKRGGGRRRKDPGMCPPHLRKYIEANKHVTHTHTYSTRKKTSEEKFKKEGRTIRRRIKNTFCVLQTPAHVYYTYRASKGPARETFSHVAVSSRLP